METSQYNRASWDPLAYGGQVMDELVDRGVPWEEVYHSGMVCLAILIEDHIGEPEVSEAENFTEAGAVSTG